MSEERVIRALFSSWGMQINLPAQRDVPMEKESWPHYACKPVFSRFLAGGLMTLDSFSRRPVLWFLFESIRGIFPRHWLVEEASFCREEEVLKIEWCTELFQKIFYFFFRDTVMMPFIWDFNSTVDILGINVEFWGKHIFT